MRTPDAYDPDLSALRSHMDDCPPGWSSGKHFPQARLMPICESPSERGRAVSATASQPNCATPRTTPSPPSARCAADASAASGSTWPSGVTPNRSAKTSPRATSGCSTGPAGRARQPAVAQAWLLRSVHCLLLSALSWELGADTLRQRAQKVQRNCGGKSKHS